MRVIVKLDVPKITEKVTNDNFGMHVSQEWKRLIDPYTPRDTGTLMNTAKVLPFKIHYIAASDKGYKYAEKVYYGYEMNFQKINPYSTYEWDIKAAQSGQLDNLCRTLNEGLRSGRY